MRDELQDTPFYLSGSLPCPYLPGRIERKLFTRMTGDSALDAARNAALTKRGFRRSHDVIYRPACPGCQACVPVRVVVDRFCPDRTQRRIARRSADLIGVLEPPFPTAEYYDLFHAYQCTRHDDSDMAQMDEAAFHAMLREGNATLQVLSLRDPQHNTLQGVMLADRVPDGFSAIYSFYHAVPANRSLGTVLVLRLIAMAAELGLPYVYLGYWIAASRKMAYKNRFLPQEHLGAGGWEIVT